MSQRARPNILFITSDQQRWDSLSALGTPGYRTPNLDRLAREGVHFERAYTPSPVCTPARVSMITGQYPSRHGAYQIGMEPVAALRGPTLASILAGHGYATASIGKTHYVARAIEHQHVAGIVPPDPARPNPDDAFWDTFDGPYLGFQYVQHGQSHTADRLPNAHYRAWLRRRGLNLDHLHHDKDGGRPNDALPACGAWAIDPDHTQTAWIAEASEAWIRRQVARGRPWFCMVNYQDPHPPYVCPEPWYGGVDMTGVDLGGVRPGEMEDKPPPLRRFLEGLYWSEEDGASLADPLIRNVPALSLYDKVVDPARAIRAYIGMVNMLDAHVGRLLATLDELGAAEDTLILFTTDHGDQLGRHGMWGKGPAAYDDNQRIPCLMRWPAAQTAGPVGRTTSMFSLVDAMPTFLDAAGIALPPGVQGISQLPLLRGETRMLRDWALVDFIATTRFHQQTLVQGGHKLVVYRDADYGELYDLERDPDQYVNLFDRPAAAAVRQRMLHRLARANMHAAGVMPLRGWPA